MTAKKNDSGGQIGEPEIVRKMTRKVAVEDSRLK
jgi:hypothetical protein